MSKILTAISDVLKEGLAYYSTPFVTLMRYDAYEDLERYEN